MLSFVILIAIIIAISTGVFAWLRYAANIEPAINCKEGTSIILTDISCSPSKIELDLKNNGRFNIDGIILTVSDETEILEPTYLIPINTHNAPRDPGGFLFDYKLKPGESVIADYSDKSKKLVGIEGYGEETPVEFTSIKTIQIQPFIIDGKSLIVCQDALIKQNTETCNLT